jgi:uncharacterized RDD family membrane protein YckC
VAGVLLFAAYYIVAHRLWGQTVGKRLLRLRIQGTTRPVKVPGLALRFAVELWAPLAAGLVLALQGTEPAAVASKLQALAVLWLAGIFFAFFDGHRQTLHDRAAHTRVVYELRPRL